MLCQALSQTLTADAKFYVFALCCAYCCVACTIGRCRLREQILYHDSVSLTLATSAATLPNPQTVVVASRFFAGVQLWYFSSQQSLYFLSSYLIEVIFCWKIILNNSIVMRLAIQLITPLISLHPTCSIYGLLHRCSRGLKGYKLLLFYFFQNHPTAVAPFGHASTGHTLQFFLGYFQALCFSRFMWQMEHLLLKLLGRFSFFRGVTRGSTRGTIPRAPKSPNNITSAFFNTVHLLPKYLSFEHGGAKLASCPGRHLTSFHPWLSYKQNYPVSQSVGAFFNLSIHILATPYVTMLFLFGALFAGKNKTKKALGTIMHVLMANLSLFWTASSYHHPIMTCRSCNYYVSLTLVPQTARWSRS